MKATWIKEMFGTEKPILAMCHLRALPGDPAYDAEKGMDYVVDCARKDLHALQDGGVDGVIFSNEFSLPYMSKVEPITVAAMTRVISEIRKEITVPYGMNVISSAMLSLDMAVALEASFIRAPITGAYVSPAGAGNLNAGEIMRHKMAIGGKDIRILSYVVPEGCDYPAQRSLADLAKIAEFRAQMDVICVAGIVAGSSPDTQDVSIVKKAVKKTPVFVNTGCTIDTICKQLDASDGAVVATTFKYDGVFENLVDVNRVKAFMDVVRQYRADHGIC